MCLQMYSVCIYFLEEREGNYDFALLLTCSFPRQRGEIMWCGEICLVII